MPLLVTAVAAILVAGSVTSVDLTRWRPGATTPAATETAADARALADAAPAEAPMETDAAPAEAPIDVDAAPAEAPIEVAQREIAPQQVAAPSIVEVEVPADQAVTRVPVELSEGDAVTVVAEGRVRNHAVSIAGPDGVPQREGWSQGSVVPELPHAALLGRVGQTGDWFLIGSGTSFVAERDGALFVRLNDAGLDNNSGTFSLTVLVSPTTPEPPWTVVQVPADSRQLVTDIRVDPGDVVTITAIGEITGAGVEHGPVGALSDPSLRSAKLLPQAGHAALLAQVGELEPVAVGRGARFAAGSAGLLALGPNDVAPQDNDGAYTAMIQVTPTPT